MHNHQGNPNPNHNETSSHPRMVIIKNSVGKDEEKENSYTLLVVLLISIPVMENILEGLPKSKNRDAIRPSNPTIGYISKRKEIITLTGYVCSNVYCSIIHDDHGREST